MKITLLTLMTAALFTALVTPVHAEEKDGSDPVLWAENVGTGCLVGGAAGALIAAHNYANVTRSAIAGCAVMGTVAGTIELKMLSPGYKDYEDAMELNREEGIE